MMRIKMILALIVWSLLLHAQSTDNSFQILLNDFEREYSSLTIPNLELSYVNNINNVGSKEELQAQKQFFLKYQNQFEQYPGDNLSEEDQVTYQVLRYEIGLNLERIALEEQWLAGNYSVQGNRLYEESLGKEWYAYFLKKWIDASLTPDAAYQIGLEEVEKVKTLMVAIQNSMNLDDAAFKKQWTDEQYYLSENTEVLTQYNTLKSKVKEKAKHYFPDVDKTPPIEIERGTNENMAIAPAYYSNNTFYYNFFGDTYDSREMGWTFLHEAIPGHHYQHHVAAQLSQTTRDLFYYMGYIEGWAAYIEQFGRELGAYSTPFDAYAQLEWDLIRSVRVALDVGLNYYGWSDKKALSFWKQHIVDKDDIARREIKRMKRWPAQVITYKYGKHILDELKGDKNTPAALKAFHQQVLEYGDIPLSVLRNHIQKKEEAYRSKLTTIDQTITSLYQVISGGKGEERDWDFMRYMFHPEAKLIVSGKRKDGSVGARYITIEEYINSSGKWMLENGFYENEMKREVQQFGPIAQVFSSYETFNTLDDKVPFMRGINSIQLMNTGERWQIINIYFTQETEDNPIPKKYDHE
jgi:hypothetical protein